MTSYDATKLSHLSCLSKSQMNRKFKTFLKISPKRYWERHRYIHVCAMLRDVGVPLSEVADKRGFADQAHLTRWFKKACNGLTPKQYREALVERIA